MFAVRVFIEECLSGTVYRANIPSSMQVDPEIVTNEWEPGRSFCQVMTGPTCPDFIDGLPDDFLDLNTFDPPYCRDPRWITMHSLLAFRWDQVPAPGATPLFNRNDLDRTAIKDCAIELAQLAIISAMSRTGDLRQLRLVSWLERG